MEEEREAAVRGLEVRGLEAGWGLKSRISETEAVEERSGSRAIRIESLNHHNVSQKNEERKYEERTE